MKVAIVVFDGAQALDVAGPLDVFAEANAFLPAHQRYEVSIVGREAGTVTCSNGMQLAVAHGFADRDIQWDLLLIAGGPQLPDTRPSGDFLSWLKNQASGASRFGSVCNGAFVLAHAGLLDGKAVTTHWADAGRLSNEFPNANVQPDRIFVRDGRLFTSAGVTAGIDLCLSPWPRIGDTNWRCAWRSAWSFISSAKAVSPSTARISEQARTRTRY